MTFKSRAKGSEGRIVQIREAGASGPQGSLHAQSSGRRDPGDSSRVGQRGRGGEGQVGHG